MTISRDDAQRAIRAGLRAATGKNAEEPGTLDAAERLKEIEGRRFNPENPPPEPRPIATLKGTVISTPGNIMTISGQAKSAKSHAAAALLAATFAPEPGTCDLLGWRADNKSGKAVIYLDAEQSEYHFHRLIMTACRRAKIEKPPEWFYGYNLTGMEPGKIKDALQDLMSTAGDRHGGILFPLVDGFADLMNTLNDDATSFDLVRWLMELAWKFETGIIGILHHNAQSDSIKMRGHLGSQIERKSETVLCCKRDAAGAVNLFTTASRGEPIPEAKAARFGWDDDEGMFLTLPDKATQQSDRKAEERAELARATLLDKVSMPHSEVVGRVVELEGVKPDAAKKRIAVLRREGFLRVEPSTGFYGLGGRAK